MATEKVLNCPECDVVYATTENSEHKDRTHCLECGAELQTKYVEVSE